VRVLDVGAGAGIASLCLAARVAGVEIAGVEIDPALVALANESAARNACAGRVRFIAGDVGAGHAPPGPFDHVFFNPPFHRDTGQVSPSAARDLARRDIAGAVAGWMARALALVKAGGTVTAIIGADRRDDILAAAGGYPVVVFPLFPRAGEAPKRLLVRMTNAPHAPLRLARGMILHEGRGNSAAAEDVLRHGAALVLE
jgi:tRNA1(Val) A37 N6-methylase TrmN6